MPRKLSKSVSSSKTDSDNLSYPSTPSEVPEDGHEKNTKSTETWMKRWVWIFVAFIVMFTVGTIVIVVVALEQKSENLPDKIDVVLYQNNTSRMDSLPDLTDAARASRYVTQARAVRRLMEWVDQVFLLTPDGSISNSEFTTVEFKGTMQQAFEFMPDIPGIADHAIFLSDMTFPFRKTEKEFMFYNARPRLFNIFREQSEVDFFQNYMELPTLPTLVTNLIKLKEPPQTWQDLVFREVTEDRIMLRDDMNRDIFVVGDMLPNAEKQFDKLVNNRPLFATFHITGSTDKAQQAANIALKTFLELQFPK